MCKKYLEPLAKEYPTIDSAASEIINLLAIRSLPKGTEYFFGDRPAVAIRLLYKQKSRQASVLQTILARALSALSQTNPHHYIRVLLSFANYCPFSLYPDKT